MVEIVLPMLNATLSSSSASIIDDIISKVTVVIEVSLNDFRNTFQLKTDQAILSLVDENPTQNQYYVNTAANTSKYSIFATNTKQTLNPAFGKVVLNPALVRDVSGNNMNPAKMALVNDYIRDLASQILGRPQLTYLITNNRVAQIDLVKKFKNTVITNIRNILLNVDVNNTTNPNLSGTTGDKYSLDQPTNAVGAQLTMNSDNICRKIMINILEQAHERFNGLSFVSKAPLPFIENDSIMFRVILDNSNQTSLVADQVQNRTYNIRLLMKAAPTNPGIDVFLAEGSIFYDEI